MKYIVYGCIAVSVCFGVYLVIQNYAPNSLPLVLQEKKTYSFLCKNNKSILATFYLKSDVGVTLTLSDGRTMFLAHVISGSGARYANKDESIVFWNKGNTAFITEQNKLTFEDCITYTTANVESVKNG